MTLSTEEGTHDIDEEFIFEGVKYHLEGYYTNTESEGERCEQGCDMRNGETSRYLEVNSATFGNDNEFDVSDNDLLRAIEKELNDNY